MKNVGHVFCQIYNRGAFGWFSQLRKVKILFPPPEDDCNNSVSLNAFASKAATVAMIVGYYSRFYKLFLTVLLERQYRHFRLSAM